MVDIETLSNRSNGVIISIGAVMFDITTGETAEGFRVDITPQSCIDVGLKMDASTVLWWMKQNDKAREDMLYCEEGLTLSESITMFSKFITDNNVKGIWGNSNRFDLGLLENAYHALCMKTPWPYWAERDVRTLVSFAPDIKKSIVNDLPHSPIHDCIYQIKYCSAIWNHINRNNVIT